MVQEGRLKGALERVKGKIFRRTGGGKEGEKIATWSSGASTMPSTTGVCTCAWREMSMAEGAVG